MHPATRVFATAERSVESVKDRPLTRQIVFQRGYTSLLFLILLIRPISVQSRLCGSCKPSSILVFLPPWKRERCKKEKKQTPKPVFKSTHLQTGKRYKSEYECCSMPCWGVCDISNSLCEYHFKFKRSKAKTNVTHIFIYFCTLVPFMDFRYSRHDLPSSQMRPQRRTTCNTQYIRIRAHTYIRTHIRDPL